MKCLTWNEAAVAAKAIDVDIDNPNWDSALHFPYPIDSGKKVTLEVAGPNGASIQV